MSVFYLRRAKQWVDPERSRGYNENGRKWEREEKGLVKSGKKVKRWEGETIISEKLESTKDIKKCESTKNELKKWSRIS